MNRDSRITRRATLTLAVAALTLAGAVAWIGTANADATPVMPAYLSGGLAECKAQLAVATTSADRTWANECVRLAQRAVDAWVKANPTPSPTATATVAPTTVPPTTPPVTTPPATTPPPTTVPPTTIPPTTPPAQTTNCLPKPSSCGFPDATNTGVPAAWAPIHTTTGDVSVTTAGATLDGWDIHGCLSILAANVTIRNTRVTCTTGGWAVNARGANLLLDHIAVTCGGTHGDGIVGVTFTAVAVDVSGCEDGIYMDNSSPCPVVRDSYVHDPFHASGAHTDVLQVAADGCGTFVHNTLENQDPQGSSVISADTTAIHDLLVSGNLMAGGGYSMRCPDPGHGTNVQVVGNRFSEMWVQYGNPPGTGAMNGCGDEAVVSGNVRDETGAAL